MNNSEKHTEVLPVMEAFYTIQGEGYHQGKAAYFIRLGGCDVGCHWCDVKESWQALNHPLLPIDYIVSEATKHHSKLAVVTGGEPLLYSLDTLTEKLQHAGWQTNIETSGAYPLNGHWDWICLSPKKFKAPVADIYEKADELKIIIYNNDDFQWAEENAQQVSNNCKLYLQPEWGKSDKMLPLIVEYVKNNPQWEISLQTHKFMDVP